jgi:D-3-phosphoglycerate dehydrogenase / 2-oxoglutarate reductase
MRSLSFKEILDSRLEPHGLTCEIVDMEKPLTPQIADAEVLVNGTSKIDKSVIDSCPDLTLVHQAGIGYDNIDIQYCTSKSIYVANVPLANSTSVAEHTLFLMVLLAKNMLASDRRVAKRRNPRVLGTELYGKTLLVVGLGASGIEVAKRAKAFGMKVVSTTKDPVSEKPGRERSFFVDEVKSPESLHEFIPDADFISIHVPLNGETRGLFDVKALSLMKPSCFLVNVARAPIVDRDALYECLKEKRIAGAAFDVFWEEPANPEDRLLQLDNFVLTPHVAGWTKESVEAIAGVIAANISRVAEGKSPLTLVNTDLLSKQ